MKCVWCGNEDKAVSFRRYAYPGNQFRESYVDYVCFGCVDHYEATHRPGYSTTAKVLGTLAAMFLLAIAFMTVFKVVGSMFTH